MFFVDPRFEKVKLSCFSHDEADIRIFVQVANAVHEGCLTLHVRTVDTYSVMVAVAAFNKIQSEAFGVAFGT